MDKSRGSVEKKKVNFFFLWVGKEIWVRRGPETKNQLGFPLIINENDAIVSHILKKVRVSRTLQYYEHIKEKSSQKSSLLKICTGGSILGICPLLEQLSNQATQQSSS